MSSPAGIEPLLLDTQYRMHPLIAHIPSKLFYDGRLQSGQPLWGPICSPSCSFLYASIHCSTLPSVILLAAFFVCLLICSSFSHPSSLPPALPPSLPLPLPLPAEAQAILPQQGHSWKLAKDSTMSRQSLPRQDCLLQPVTGF